MRTIPCNSPLRLALMFVVVIWSVFTCGAQAPTAAPQAANATAKTIPSTQTKDAKLTPPPGKMRGLTNEMRWAAAIRTADRRAKAHQKGKKSIKAEVNQ